MDSDCSKPKTAKPATKVKSPIPYVISFQVQRFYKGKRYYWMICREDNPDELVAWGHSLTQELAETAAQNEVKALSSSLSKGGHVIDTSKPVIQHWRYLRPQPQRALR